MSEILADEIRERLQEIDPCIEFDDKNHDKLIGYAERFGCHFIPLYLGVNTFIVKDPEEAERLANLASSTPVFPMPQMNVGIIGYVTFDGCAALLYDKEKYLQHLADEYEKDGIEIDEEWESYYSNAVEWYEFNDLGYGLSDSITQLSLVQKNSQSSYNIHLSELSIKKFLIAPDSFGTCSL